MPKKPKQNAETQTELSEDELARVQGGATDDVYIDGNIITAENYDSAAAAKDGSRTRASLTARFKKDQAVP
ncbi:MAG: hypothetical protein RIM84_12840 [Alphaproteobacteria bacterium]